jgi:hypothetical protein
MGSRLLRFTMENAVRILEVVREITQKRPSTICSLISKKITLCPIFTFGVGVGGRGLVFRYSGTWDGFYVGAN